MEMVEDLNLRRGKNKSKEESDVEKSVDAPGRRKSVFPGEIQNQLIVVRIF